MHEIQKSLIVPSQQCELILGGIDEISYRSFAPVLCRSSCSFVIVYHHSWLGTPSFWKEKQGRKLFKKGMKWEQKGEKMKEVSMFHSTKKISDEPFEVQ
jgi:hypothetical protein